MNRKLKLALAALLGFSGACSSVKNTPKSADPQASGIEVEKNDTTRRIMVMYGVRNPRTGNVATPLPESKKAQDSLRKPVNRHPAHVEVDPVAEQPKD